MFSTCARVNHRVPIPAISLPPSDADKGLRRNAFTALRDILQKHGCCLLKGSLVPQDVLGRSFRESKRFFSLPSATKQSCCPAPLPLAQGYFAPQGEQIRGQPCHKENYDCYGSENDELNSWPAEELAFPDRCKELHEAFSKAQDYLLEGLGNVLKEQVSEEVSEEILKAHDGTNNLLSFNRYLPTVADEHQCEQQIRSPAHTDLSTLTLLLQDNVGGLQVADMDSTDKTSSKDVDHHAAFWDVDPDPSSVLLITGYFATLWPLDWKGSVHRVVTPPSHENPERFSIAYFITPNAETTIKYKRGHKNKILNVGEHIRKKREEIH